MPPPPPPPEQKISQALSFGGVALHTANALQEERAQEDAKVARQKNLVHDINVAWEILCPPGKTVVTKSQLFDYMKSLFPNTSAKDIRDLVGPGNLSLEKLQNLLADTMDADAEAFAHIDPQGAGLIDMNVIYRLLTQMPGIDTLDESDKSLIQNLLDADKDGKVSMAEDPPEHLKALLKEREIKERIKANELAQQKEKEAKEKAAKGR
eukprot:gene7887-1100_t